MPGSFSGTLNALNYSRVEQSGECGCGISHCVGVVLVAVMLFEAFVVNEG